MSDREALNEQLAKLPRVLKQFKRQILSSQYNCSCCGGPRNGGNCPGCRIVGTRNGFVYDQNPYSYNETPNFFNQPPQHPIDTYSCKYCGGPHYSSDCQTGNTPVYEQGPCYNQIFSDDQPPFYSSYQQQQFDCCEVCGGPHYSSDSQTRNQLVYEPSPCNNYDFPYFDQPLKYHMDQSPPQDLDFESDFMHSHRDTNRILGELLRTLKTNFLVGEPKRSNDLTEVPFDNEQILRQHNTAHVTPSPLSYTPPPPFLATMEPLDTFLMGDEVISTTPIREDDKFIKSSVDDLVLILRESELTLDSTDLECSMPIDPPLLCTDVLGDAIVDIDLPLGEHLDTLSTGDREVNFNPCRDIEELESLVVDDPVPVPRVFDEPLGHSDSIPRTFDVTFSNSLFDFNDDYTLCYDNPLFDEEFEDISSLDPLSRLQLLMSLL
ncbi:hypothetical protein Tco_0700657 [Tanacetum coccineum]